MRQGCVAAFGVTDSERGTEQLVVIAETTEKNKVERNKIINTINETMTDTLDIVPDLLC